MSHKPQNRQDHRKTMMLEDPLPSVILKMAVPSIIAFLINAIYSLADTYFVSSLGTNATAAVSVNASLDQIIMMAGSMLAVGANSYIARLLGARDDEKAGQVLSTAFSWPWASARSSCCWGSASCAPCSGCWGPRPPVSSTPWTTPPMCCWWLPLWPPTS